MKVALLKLLYFFKFLPRIIVGKFKKFFNLNSQSYWNFRLLFNWSSIGGSLQTSDFAKCMIKEIDFINLKVDSILDYGCALGDSVPHLRGANKYAAIGLYDISQVGLTKALLNHRQYDVHKYKKTKKYDFVYCSNVIEHIVDTEDLILDLIAASKKFVCIQFPFNELHPDGKKITPSNPLGEHIYTIDDNFISTRILQRDLRNFKFYAGHAPLSWPNGMQGYLLLEIQ